MSSDGARRFRRGFTWTVGVLAVASVGLGLAGTTRGPEFVTAATDGALLTHKAGSWVVLQVNQPVDRVDGELTVTPHEPASFTVDDDRIVVEFERPLPSDTEFTIAIDGVVGTQQPGSSDLEYTFTTDDEPIYTLVRRSADGRPDVVRRSSLADDTEHDVIEAPRLQSFAHAGDAVVAVAIEDDGTNTLRVAGIGDGVQTVGLPEPGVVRGIGASTTNPLVAFRFSGTPPPGGTSTYEDALFTLDVSGQAAAPVVMTGLDGAPLAVSDWRFVPGTTTLVVRTLDGAFFLVDGLGIDTPAPLGAHAELRGLLPGTTDLVVADPDRGTLIDLVTGESTLNDLPVYELPEESYPGRVLQLDADGAYLMEVLTVSEDAGSVSAHSVIVHVDAEGTEVRYETSDTSRLLQSCLSPNGRLLAVETAAQGAQSDGYPNDPQPLDRFTTIVDVATGDVVRAQNGGSSDWCH